MGQVVRSMKQQRDLYHGTAYYDATTTDDHRNSGSSNKPALVSSQHCNGEVGMTMSTGTKSGTLTPLGQLSVRETLLLSRPGREQTPPFDRLVSPDSDMFTSGMVDSLRICSPGDDPFALTPITTESTKRDSSHSTKTGQQQQQQRDDPALDSATRPSSIDLLDVNKNSNTPPPKNTTASYCKHDDVVCTERPPALTFSHQQHIETPPRLPPVQRRTLPLPQRMISSPSKIPTLPQQKISLSSKIPAPPMSSEFTFEARCPPAPRSYLPSSPTRPRQHAKALKKKMKTFKNKTKTLKKKTPKTTTPRRRRPKNATPLNDLDKLDLVATDSDDWCIEKKAARVCESYGWGLKFMQSISKPAVPG
ncbi:hypothetical protein [Absidia glauca]|uniref:Uncharacterized protein n=1 Tax=Absidia glauca TaxID=4829 RepID=A0A168PQY2_ABSGL|nr:hypothetical protein [Absidia glauca]